MSADPDHRITVGDRPLLEGGAMPRKVPDFKIHLRRYTQEDCTLTIEAPDLKTAEQLARKRVDQVEEEWREADHEYIGVWEEGNDIKDPFSDVGPF